MLYAINKETKEHRDITKCSDEEYQYVYCDKQVWQIVQTDGEGWISWKGESYTPPLNDGVAVELKFRDSNTEKSNNPECYIWQHYGEDDDVMAYRIIEPDLEGASMTIDEFDEKLKGILREAAESGIGVEHISVGLTTNMMGEYHVVEVSVEYRSK